MNRLWLVVALGMLALLFVGGFVLQTAAQQSPLVWIAQAGGDSSAAGKFQAATSEWKNKIVPAAKKEGEVIWYSCAQATDAEETIKLFNKTYPGIQVSQVLGPGYQLVEKISTEAS